MAKVKKANRIVEVRNDALASYLSRGYSQINDEGEVIKRPTGGITVSVAEHNKALAEVDALKAELAEAQANAGGADVEALEKEIEALKKENATLKGKVTKLENEAKK